MKFKGSSFTLEVTATDDRGNEGIGVPIMYFHQSMKGIVAMMTVAVVLEKKE